MFPSLMHIVRISPCYFLNWCVWGNISVWQCVLCVICILVIIQYCQLLKLITQDPVPPPAPHNNRLSYISLPGDRSSLSSLCPGRGPGQLREAQHQGRGREPGGRAARPSSTYEMLNSGQRSSSHQARLQPLVRWGTSFLQTLVVIVRPDTRSESKYRISMTVVPPC